MKFERLTSKADILGLIEFHNSNSQFLVIDTETTSTDAKNCGLLDIQISGYEKNSAVAIGTDQRILLEKLNKDICLVGHNYKFDLQVLLAQGVDLDNHTWRDTMLMQHLLDENLESYSLDSLVQSRWKDNYKEIFWAKYQDYESAPPDEQLEYACKDIIYTEQLYLRLLWDLQRQKIPDSLIEQAHNLQKYLAQTERTGIKVDVPYLLDLGTCLQQKINTLLPKMQDCVKYEIESLETEMWVKELDKRKTPEGKKRVEKPVFSFESATQLKSLLYDHLALPVQRNPKTKNISTDFKSLENIKHMHPVVELIQGNRELQKVYGSFIVGTNDRLVDGRIYPEFRVNGTVTGRISHSNPNLGQLPATGGIRGIYIPDPGNVLISADYSQLEVIIEANLTQDKVLLKMIQDGESKHDLTARELGIDRGAAKTLNFALQFWASSYKVAQMLNISESEGKRIWDKYWEVYSGPKRLKAKTDKQVDLGIPLVNSFGRKRRFQTRKRSPWDSDYRQAYNFIIQGTGADMTSCAFVKIAKYFDETRFGRALFTVHDEIIVECKSDYSSQVESKLVECMDSVSSLIGLEVPVKAVSSGPMLRWED